MEVGLLPEEQGARLLPDSRGPWESFLQAQYSEQSAATSTRNSLTRKHRVLMLGLLSNIENKREIRTELKEADLSPLQYYVHLIVNMHFSQILAQFKGTLFQRQFTFTLLRVLSTPLSIGTPVPLNA